MQKEITVVIKLHEELLEIKIIRNVEQSGLHNHPRGGKKNNGD